MAVRHTRNVPAQVRFLVDALDFACEVGLLIDNLAIATGTEMLSVAWLTLNQLVAVQVRAVPIFVPMV